MPKHRILLLCAFVCAASALADSGGRRTRVVDVVEQTRNVVVNISTREIVYQREGPRPRGRHFFDQLWEDFFLPRSYRRTQVLQPLGSGVVLDETGLVLTSAHVIRRASNLKLLMADGAEYEGKLLAADVEADLALLRVEDLREPLETVRLCRSDAILGETVIALGNPFGLSNSVTTGVVSSIERDLEVGEGDFTLRFQNLIQTSALINPGNSGGPLLNMDGELMGINTAIVHQAQGIGFAIPVCQVRKVLARLMSTPDVRPVAFGVGLNAEGPARVVEVGADTPAAAAGLAPGDILERVDGRRVRDTYDFALSMMRCRPGQSVEVEFRRDGELRTARVVLGDPPKPAEEEMVARRLGMVAQDVTQELAEAMDLPIAWGALVAEVEARGPAAQAGLRQGDVIVQIGRYRVQSVAQAARALREIRPGDKVYVSVVRGGYLAYTHAQTR